VTPSGWVPDPVAGATGGAVVTLPAPVPRSSLAPCGVAGHANRRQAAVQQLRCSARLIWNAMIKISCWKSRDGTFLQAVRHSPGDAVSSSLHSPGHSVRRRWRSPRLDGRAPAIVIPARRLFSECAGHGNVTDRLVGGAACSASRRQRGSQPGPPAAVRSPRSKSPRPRSPACAFLHLVAKTTANSRPACGGIARSRRRQPSLIWTNSIRFVRPQVQLCPSRPRK